MTLISRTFIAVSILLLSVLPALSHAENDVGTAAKCAALATTDFSGVLDAPTQVTEAKLVKSDQDMPAYCQVMGYVTPNVGIEIRLPTESWNGKFIEIGCGGNCGETDATGKCIDPVRRGYACI